MAAAAYSGVHGPAAPLRPGPDGAGEGRHMIARRRLSPGAKRKPRLPWQAGPDASSRGAGSGGGYGRSGEDTSETPLPLQLVWPPFLSKKKKKTQARPESRTA